MILDISALSALAEGDSAVVAEVSHASQVAVPVIVLGEYRFGIARSRHHSEYERWLAEILSVSRVLDVSEETTIRYAEIRVELKEVGTPIPSNDVWIAALSRQYALPVLTRDQHFDLVEGLRRLDW